MLFSLATAVLFAGSLAAQQDTVRTLIHIPKVRQIGLYVAPEFQYGQSNAAFTSFAQHYFVHVGEVPGHGNDINYHRADPQWSQLFQVGSDPRGRALCDCEGFAAVSQQFFLAAGATR